LIPSFAFILITWRSKCNKNYISRLHLLQEPVHLCIRRHWDCLLQDNYHDFSDHITLSTSTKTEQTETKEQENHTATSYNHSCPTDYYVVFSQYYHLKIKCVNIKSFLKGHNNALFIGARQVSLSSCYFDLFSHWFPHRKTSIYIHIG